MPSSALPGSALPRSVDALRERGLIAADWAEALAAVPGLDDRLAGLSDFLQGEEAAGRGHQPATDQIFAAFRRPLAQVRVLVVGQDPYPNPAHPIGLSFAVAADVRPLPPSLRNIYAELSTDLGIAPAPHGDLSGWAEAGVMLLNRVLTVSPGVANSHRGRGWEAITEAAIKVLVTRGGPLVAVLWGAQAAQLTAWLGEVPTIASVHPSPLSARKGFFGSRPFSRANELLVTQGADPIDWRVAT